MRFWTGDEWSGIGGLPRFAHAVARLVESGQADLGIVICGSGNGVAMSANKHPGVRAALAWTEEIARLGREHNNANVLALPARFISCAVRVPWCGPSSPPHLKEVDMHAGQTRSPVNRMDMMKHCRFLLLLIGACFVTTLSGAVIHLYS